jgi:signal transduction histidine kinase
MLDSLSRLVAGISRAPDQVRELEALADQALQEIRVTSHLLHPPLLDEVGFSSAAQWYVDGFAKRSGIKTNLELAATPSLTKDEELVFFRILQEGLTNTLRHSGSPAVDIRLSADSEYAILSIKDYGKGIPDEKLKTFREIGAGVGVGLGGMKQRVRNLGGHLTVNSDGVGTCVTATLPLAKPAQSTGESDQDASPAA